jgi:hypothetical protein
MVFCPESATWTKESESSQFMQLGGDNRAFHPGVGADASIG